MGVGSTQVLSSASVLTNNRLSEFQTTYVGSVVLTSELPLSTLVKKKKNLPAKAGDLGSTPRSGRSLGEGNDYPFQYSCLENPITEEPSRLQPMGS